MAGDFPADRPGNGRDVEGESSIFLGARTSAPGAGGRSGVYYNAVVPEYSSPPGTAWIYGLQQNGETRSNVALVNTGQLGGGRDIYSIDLFDGASNVYSIDLFDGDTGLRVNALSGIKLDAFRWMQIDMILARFAPTTKHGYARILRTSGPDDFIAYGVINDGGQPGERTGDGAFVLSSR